MILALLVGAAFAYPQTSIPFEEPLVPPSALYEGPFSSPPVAQWSATLPGGTVAAANHAERSRPTVIGEHILVGSAGGDALYMLSRRDGSLVRTFPASASVEAEATIDAGRVYFADTAGRTWAYDLDGTLLWKHESAAPIVVQPTVHDGRVFVTNVNDLAVALDADSGALLWRHRRRAQLGRQAELALYAAPPAVIMDGLVLFGFSDGALVALDQDRGEVAWEKSVGEGRYPDLVAAPVPHGPDVFAAGYFEPLVAIDRQTRNVRWRIDAGGAAPGIVLERDAGAVLYHPGTDGRLRAIITMTGAERWIWDSETDGALTTPVATEAGLVIASSDGSVYIVDPETGLELWRYRGDRRLDGVTVAPVVDGRQMLFVTNAGRIYSMLAPRPPRERQRGFWQLGDRR